MSQLRRTAGLTVLRSMSHEPRQPTGASCRKQPRRRRAISFEPSLAAPQRCRFGVELAVAGTVGRVQLSEKRWLAGVAERTRKHCKTHGRIRLLTEQRPFYGQLWHLPDSVKTVMGNGGG